MGRAIRRVPPNWQHPKKKQFNPITRETEERYQPLYDESAEDAFQNWNAEYQKWLDGEHRRIVEEYGEENFPLDQPYRSFCDWHGQPPDPTYCRPPWTEAEATWWQVYETVSEGTPVTPPFETPEELIDYLVANGDFWDQSRRKEGCSIMNCDPWPREQAENFVKAGCAPSLIEVNGVLKSGVEALSELKPKEASA